MGWAKSTENNREQPIRFGNYKTKYHDMFSLSFTYSNLF